MGVDRVELRQASCPANTLQAGALEHDVSFTPGKVVGIGLVIPWGHAFLTGLAIAQAHQVVIPRTGSSWFTSDDEKFAFDYHDQIWSGQWSVFVYNTDIVNAHTWYLRFYIQELTPTQESQVQAAISPSDLAAVAAPDVSSATSEGAS